MSEPVDFVAKLNALKEAKGLNTPAAPAPPQPRVPPVDDQGHQWDKSVLLPEMGPKLTEEQVELDSFVDSIDIIAAYNKWCGKMRPDPGNKREGIMVSCPNPAHPDKDPSAWISLDKQTYFCGGCQEGGDAHDIAAMNLGYPVPGYKTGEKFHELREQMAADFGFRSKKVPGGTVTWVEDQAHPAHEVRPTDHLQPAQTGDAPAEGGQVPGEAVREDAPGAEKLPGPADTQGSGGLAPVAQMWADDALDDLVVYPTINWRGIVREDTFLYEYMEACSNDDAPEEYHFWHGLMALGLVAHKKVYLDDTLPVYGNLLVCILGNTGAGKSKSRRHMTHVLREVVPYHEDGAQTSGVKLMPVPSSGEYLVSSFSYLGKDPSNPKKMLGLQPVTGFVDFDEMSALLTRANRPGSVLKTTIMSLADVATEVSVGSLGRGDIVAQDPFFSTTASTQPRAVRSIMGRMDAASGFLNRWVFAGGKQKETEVIGGARSMIRVDLTKAIEQLTYVNGWAGMERRIELEDDAYERMVSFFRTKLFPVREKDDTDLLKRIDLLFKKLILLFAVNEKASKVTLAMVESVISLFDYVVDCYGILSENIGITQSQDVMNEILRHIKRHQEKTGRGASPNDLVRYTHRKNYGLDQIKKALEVMTALDMIELAPKQQGAGRPTVRYLAVGE